MLTRTSAAALVNGARRQPHGEEMDKQRIKIINNTVIKGKGVVAAGTTHTVDARTARELFAAGKAVPVDLKPPQVSTRKKTAIPAAKAKK